ncbi:enoyl-CoA hydratase-related protein [Thalassobaculum sp.]|uniref:enoyl-CoA hydratase-related protein n=1 Tax=Thalassobaculum sp. TaxID=2022740 RepID=UPI0032EB0C0E
MSLVEITQDSGVATVTLSRPEKRNALSSDAARAVAAAFGELSRDDALRVVLLNGAGPSFCAGADVREMAGLDPVSAEAFIRGLHHAIAAVMDCPVPVVAAIQGTCVGAGLELVAGADLRIAADDARFAMPEVLVGVPSVIEAALLPRLIGRGRSARLVLTGEVVGAALAERWGLVEEVVATGELAARAAALVQSIAEADPAAVRAQKLLCRQWDTLALADAVEASVAVFAASFTTDVPRRRMAAALERRG